MLALPLSANGERADAAFLPADLAAAAQADPERVFAVIVQGEGAKRSSDVASDVNKERAANPGKGQGVRRRFATISGVSAELTGRQIVKLAAKNGILAITRDARITAGQVGDEPAPTTEPTGTGGVSPGLSAPTLMVAVPTITGPAIEGALLTATDFVAGAAWERCDTAYGDEVAADAPGRYWRLDGTGTDGVAVDSSALEITPGGGLAVGDVANAELKSGFTIEAWVRVDAPQQDRGIAGKWRYADGGGALLWINQEGRYALAVGRDYASYVMTTVAPVVGAWEHIAGTWDGATLRLYRNGVEIGSKAFVGDIGSPLSGFEIGRYGDPVAYLDGAVDEVALYSRAVAADRIRRHAAAGCRPIAGATSSTYTVAAPDVGERIRVRVFASAGDQTATALSTPTATIAAATPPPPAPTAPSVLAAPTVSGTALDGQTLTATTGDWAGTFPLSHTYRWQRCDAAGGACADVAGASAQTYALGVADVGSTLRVVVSAANAAGSAEAPSAATGVVAPVAPLLLAAPAIAGTAAFAQTLTASGGEWGGTAPIERSYRWQRCALGACVDIAGATGSTYALTAEDVGATVRVVVSATNAAGSVTAESPATAVVSAAAPTNLAPPAVAGVAVEGELLSATAGDWSGSAPIETSYRWQRCALGACADIPGAAGTTYSLAAADVGAAVRVVVSARNAAGSVDAESAPTAVVKAAVPRLLTAPTVAGVTVEGETLTATAGEWSGSAPIEKTYRWQRCALGACADVAGETMSTYTLGAADVGGTVRVVVSATNAAGSLDAESAPTAVVSAAAPRLVAAPTVQGTSVEGQTLTASPGEWTGSAPIARAYRWQRCGPAGDCVDIAGAASATYSLTGTDVGSSVRVVVSATNAAGSVDAESAPTAVVTAAAPTLVAAPTINGASVEGQSLTATAGEWSGSAPIEKSFRWQRCALGACTDIPGATAATYTLAAEDVGAIVRVVVSATNAAGAVQAESAATAVVTAAAPRLVSAPTVAGVAVEGRAVTASGGEWSGSKPIETSFRWQRCAADGSCAEIAGATGASYTLTAADVGTTVRVVVSATNVAGSAVAESAATAVVTAAAPALIAAPTVVGEAVEGRALTATGGEWSGTAPIDRAYRWQRCALGACTDIAGATAATYTLTAEDVGATVRVVVSATNAAGLVEAESAATPAVTAAAPKLLAAPTVTGAAVEGSTVTATGGEWSGAGVQQSLRWQRCALGACTDIPGATAATYTLTAADVGATVRVVATATNAAGTVEAESAPTGAVVPAAPGLLAAPAVGGVAVAGQTLTASGGEWSGSAPIAYAYRWQRCALGACADVADATGPTYTLTDGDVGATVRVVVSATNAAGSVEAASAATAVVAAAAPTAAAAPAVAGVAVEGETLTATAGDWSGSAPIDTTFRWQRCALGACADVAGATTSTYTLAAADVGGTVRVVVSATNSAGTVEAESAPTAVVTAAAPRIVAAPTVDGAAVEGQTLTATAGEWSGSAPIEKTYRWQRCALGACADVAGATAATYSLTAADVGASVRVVVSATNAAGSVEADSAATAVVVAAAPRVVAAPAVAGVAVAGQTLTVTGGEWSGTAPIAYAYRWERCAAAGACVEIFGATGSAYTLTGEDVGTSVRVVVTATNAAGSLAAESAATAVVTAAAPTLVSAPTVAGVAVEGETLAATAGEWGGSAPIEKTYRWQRCALGACADVAGATAATYSLTAADVGATVRVVVSATNAAGSVEAESAPSTTVTAAAPTLLAAPTVTGGAVAGQTLSTTGGEWSTTVERSYRWQRCVAGACVDVAGATGPAYTLTAEDVGSTLRVVVSGSTAGGSLDAESAPTAVVTAAAPTALAAPVVTGLPAEGETLNATAGEWSGSAPIEKTYRWQRCALGACTDIAGATTASYVAAAGDVGATLRVVVSATNTAGSAEAESAPTAVVAAAAPRVVAAPTIGGAAVATQTLTATAGEWSGSAPIEQSYRWQRCNAAGAACVDIAGATAARYTLAAEDVGATIRVVVSATNTAGSVEATSAPTGAVAGAAPVALEPPVIVGVPEDGATLIVTPGTWSGLQLLERSVTWSRCSAGACTPIAAAAGTSYAISELDVGATLRATVVASNAAGTATLETAETSVVSDSYTALQQWPQAISVAPSWAAAKASQATPTIAVVDSGVERGRGDFGGRVVHEVSLASLAPNSGGDGRGHGTFVSSIAAGEGAGYAGVVPNARLVSIDILDDSGRATTSDVIAAADWIYQNRAAHNIRVANFSLHAASASSFRLDPLNKAVQRLWFSGVVVVTAAGNYAVDGAKSGVPYAPANDPFVLTVGATDTLGTVATDDDVAAPWSAWGYTTDGFAKPDLGAPGRYMVGAVPPNATLPLSRPQNVIAPGYMQLSGTSFAAPVVAGAAAFVLTVHPQWTPDQVKGALMVAASHLPATPIRSVGVGALHLARAAAVVTPPNPNLALNKFLVPDPAGGPEPVFDGASWTTAVQADPAWGAEAWGAEAWGAEAWGAEAWGAEAWGAEAWGAEAWGANYWEPPATTATGGTGELEAISTFNNALDEWLPAGGYWLTPTP